MSLSEWVYLSPYFAIIFLWLMSVVAPLVSVDLGVYVILSSSVVAPFVSVVLWRLCNSVLVCGSLLLSAPPRGSPRVWLSVAPGWAGRRETDESTFPISSDTRASYDNTITTDCF